MFARYFSAREVVAGLQEQDVCPGVFISGLKSSSYQQLQGSRAIVTGSATPGFLRSIFFCFFCNFFKQLGSSIMCSSLGGSTMPGPRIARSPGTRQ